MKSSPLADFLGTLFDEGQAVLRPPPPSPRVRDLLAEKRLAVAFADYRLSVAGQPIGFDASTALLAAEAVYRAAWFLVDHSQPANALKEMLTLPRPTTPSQHLSADLVFRYVPYLHRRAKARNPDDVLTTHLAELLQAWPLAGVLSDVEAGPISPLDFGGHGGLQMLYAERWCQRCKADWLPPPGPVLERVQLVWRESGKDNALLQSMIDATLEKKEDKDD